MAGSRLLLFLLALCAFFLTAPPLRAERAAPLMQNNQAVRIEITSLTFDQQNNIYTLGLSIDRPERIQRVVLQVESEAGTVAIDEPVNPAGRPTLTLEFDANRLGAPGQYLIKIRAIDLVGNLVERQDDIGSNGEPSVLASREFQFAPDTNTLNFTIESVNADYAGDRLIIILNVEQPERVVLSVVTPRPRAGSRQARIRRAGEQQPGHPESGGSAERRDPDGS